MTSTQHRAPSLWMIVILVVLASRSLSDEMSTVREETLTVIQDYIASSDIVWPQTWRTEYVETIRKAINTPENLHDCIPHLEILQKGFPVLWDDLHVKNSRTWFEVQCAQVRWYTEHLMNAPLSRDIEKDMTRRQWTALWRHATGSLLAQFSFLDPTIVRSAEADHLHHCLGCIESPFIPIFQKPFTAEQMNTLKHGWHEMRYDRIALMIQLGGEAVFMAKSNPGKPLSSHPHHRLTQQSLEQFISCIWSTIAHSPDYHTEAWRKHNEAEMRRHQQISQAQTRERLLTSKRFRQLPQTEYLSFLLAVVLDSPQHFTSSLPGDTATITPPNSAEASSKEVMPMR